jgi:threonylcarbamoyladenosine tRNA methylthiotransferase MtaB
MIINSQKDFINLLNSCNNKTFEIFSFGCRVNAAEINQISEIFIQNGFKKAKNANIFLVNTCAITKKGETESLSKIRVIQRQFPQAKIIATGCANFQKINNIFYFNNKNKEKLLNKLFAYYSPQIGDKYTPYRRFLLKVQSGCTQNCTYCIVPQKRSYLFSLPISQAIKTIKKIEKDYDEIIITGVNLIQYKYGFSNLLEKILKETKIKLISFGSIPLNCIDDKFLELIKSANWRNRIKNFLHIPIQSGNDRILKLMHRPYNKEKILKTFNNLQSKNYDLSFGTDIIVGFPTETKKEFLDTLKLCQQIGFKKIHTFRYSPRPNTEAKNIFEKSKQIDPEELKRRSLLIRNLTSQTKAPSRQKLDKKKKLPAQQI